MEPDFSMVFSQGNMTEGIVEGLCSELLFVSSAFKAQLRKGQFEPLRIVKEIQIHW